MNGASTLAIPWASISRAIVTRDRSPSSSGSTMPLAIAVSGPPTPRTVHVLGGSSSVISSVLCNFRGPTSRVTTAFNGASPSRRADTTPPCHSGKCEKSVAYRKTSSGPTGYLNALYDRCHLFLLCSDLLWMSPGRGAEHPSPRATRSSWRRRAGGQARMSYSSGPMGSSPFRSCSGPSHRTPPITCRTAGRLWRKWPRSLQCDCTRIRR